MKYGMIAGLLAAIGAVAFAGQSHAGNRYCSYYPEDPNCYQSLYGQGGAYQAPGDDYDDEEFDGGDVNYQPSLPLRPVLRSAKSCEGVGRELRRFGYRYVRAVACGGPSYKYVAYLGYQRFMVKVNSRSGAIIFEINY
jgi:hypothetical protein